MYAILRAKTGEFTGYINRIMHPGLLNGLWRLQRRWSSFSDGYVDVFPISKESSVKRGTPIPILNERMGVCSVHGRRSSMEDFYTYESLREDLLFLGVWDGHGGKQCAEFCAQNSKSQLLRLLSGKNIADPLDLPQILTKFIYSINKSFKMTWNDRKLPSPGSTATLALIRDGYELVVAQVGDSRAILCRKGNAKTLTKDHCPSLSQETERIIKYGGTVDVNESGKYLVNKRLSMSRSLGNFELNPFGVIPHPDIVRLRINHSVDQFLILVTDGITHSLSDKDVVETIKSCSDPREAAEKVVDRALLYGSEDNTTALILPLGFWGKDESKPYNFFSLGRSLSSSYRFG